MSKLTHLKVGDKVIVRSRDPYSFYDEWTQRDATIEAIGINKQNGRSGVRINGSWINADSGCVYNGNHELEIEVRPK